MQLPKDLTYYVDAAADSTTRARRVLIVIITVSVLVFAAFWNSRLVSWQNSRLGMAQAAVLYKVWDRGNRPVRPGPEREAFDNARSFAAERGLSGEREIEEYEGYLQKAQIDNVQTLHVPVFGFSFDVNDLGMLGGFALVVSLMWFRFSLNRERDNLELVFREAAETGCLAESYTLLAMRQVLTVPRLGGVKERHFWKKLPALLFALPFLCQLTVCTHDIMTRGRGETVSPWSTSVLYVTESLFLALLGVLTIASYRLSSEIERRWDKEAEELWPRA
jgi:hypothetical protein